MNSSKLIMANHPDLLDQLARHFDAEYTLEDGSTPWWVIRALVSSPRLADVFVRNFDSSGYTEVGDTLLEKHTMLGDRLQKTYGVSLERWSRTSCSAEVVETYDFRDRSVSRIQIWPFEPSDLSAESLKIAVVVSYTALELIREHRIVGAINELMASYKFQADPYEN